MASLAPSGPTHSSTESPYGSDRAGLVWAYRFVPGHPGRPIESDEAAEFRGAASPDADTFLWLHFSLSNASSEKWLREHLTLPEAFYDSLRDNPSTRVEALDAALVAVIRDVPFFDTEEGSDATVVLCVDQRLMVSARTKQLRSVDRLRVAVRAGAPFQSPFALLAHLLRDQADVLVEIGREATAQIDTIEDRFESALVSGGRRRLGIIRRRLVRLQRLLAPEPAALFRLLNQPSHLLGETDVADLRRSAEELSTAVSDIRAVIERVRILQDELSAQLDEATNRTLYVLTILTAFAVPFEAISQLFGMGVGGLPFRDNPYGFLIVFLLIVGVIGLGAILLRRLSRDG